MICSDWVHQRDELPNPSSFPVMRGWWRLPPAGKQVSHGTIYRQMLSLSWRAELRYRRMWSSKKSKREEFQVLSVVKAGLISGRSIKLSLSRSEAPLENWQEPARSTVAYLSKLKILGLSLWWSWPSMMLSSWIPLTNSRLSPHPTALLYQTNHRVKLPFLCFSLFQVLKLWPFEVLPAMHDPPNSNKEGHAASDHNRIIHRLGVCRQTVKEGINHERNHNIGTGDSIKQNSILAHPEWPWSDILAARQKMWKNRKDIRQRSQ